ncbi:MAG: sugar ABC transporter permease [Sulfuritalea sp.]|nr:sugar ABC transporter permease [Sulfuritalea sp.]
MSELVLPAVRPLFAGISRAAATPWLLSAPALVLMALMLIGPAIAVTLLAFTNYQLGASDLNWIGFDNFREMAHERTFWRSLGNTLLYAAVVVPGSVLLGLGAALLVESGGSLRSFYRAVFFLPVMATLIAMAIAWEFMLHPNFGLVNLALKALGFAGANWLRTDTLALGVIAVIGIWQQFGFNMVLFIAGLVSIPRHLYEAAAMDGASGPWARFRLVTWPMLGPVTLFVVLISTIRSFQVFDTVAVLTKGGPNKATEVLLYTMYAEGFEFFRSGYAAAITVVFLVLVLIVTLIKRRLMEKQVHYV